MTTNDELIARAREWQSDVAYGAPWSKVGEDGDYQVVDRISKQIADCEDRDIAVGIAAAPELIRNLKAALEQSEKARVEAENEHAEFRRRLLKILKPVGIDNGLLDVELAQIRMQDLSAAEAKLSAMAGIVEAEQLSAKMALRDLGELRREFGQYRRDCS